MLAHVYDSSAQPGTPKWESANLDVLRSIAVLMVVVFHLFEVFHIAEGSAFGHQLGQWGVLLFFVHTSLVLMLSLDRQGLDHPRFNGLVFLVRRLFRIYPLSVLAVAIVCALRLPIGDTVHGQFVSSSFDLKTELSNYLLVQNLTHSDSVMAPLWTLPFEMQMYLVLPFLFLIAKRSRGALPLFGIWLAAALLAPKSYVPNPDKLADYVPCFVAGVIGFKLLEKPHARLPFWGWLCLLALTSGLFLERASLKCGWICCLVVGAMVPQFRELKAGWLQRATQLVARYSYGIYLSHYAFIWLAFQRLHGVPLALRWLVFLTGAAVTPVILYHALEAPMIAVGRRLVRSRPAEPSLAK